MKRIIEIEISNVSVEESGVGHGYYSFDYTVSIGKDVTRYTYENSYSGHTVSSMQELLQSNYPIGIVMVRVGEDME